MAHQMHYTSAAAGLSSRPGFQFVAASPGATEHLQNAMLRHLSYRPPHSAPSRPTAAQLRDFPVALGFEREEFGMVLVQCRYLGEDYSGRFGNFLGHAVVAGEAELGGVHPIQLWGSSLWAVCAAERSLPDLAELPPGMDMGREAVAAWLTGHTLLGHLIDAALSTLDGVDGRVVLVSERVPDIARWIAAISYSLPRSRVWELSFLTYTADPDRATRHLVGTTPDSWAGGESLTRHFSLDTDEVPDTPLSRYATIAADAWRRNNFRILDRLHDLVERVAPGERDAVVVIATASRGVAISETESQAAAELLVRAAPRLPDWIWEGFTTRADESLGLPLAAALNQTAVQLGLSQLAERLAPIHLSLALAVPGGRGQLKAIQRLSDAARDRVRPALDARLRRASEPGELAELLELARRQGIPVDGEALRVAAGRAARSGRGNLDAILTAVEGDEQALLLQGAVAGLTDADAAVLDLAITDLFCELTFDEDWTDAPRIGVRVLTRSGLRHPQRRVGVSHLLIDLAERHLVPENEIDRNLELMWRAPPPGITECLNLLRAQNQAVPGNALRRLMSNVAGRAFAEGDTAGEEALMLARGVLTILGSSAEPVIADASAILAVDQLARGDLARACVSLEKSLGGNKKVFQTSLNRAAAAFLNAGPILRTNTLAALPPKSRVRTELVGKLLAIRGRAGELAVVEVAVRLFQRGRPDPSLSARTAKIAKRTGETQFLSIRLAQRDKALPSALAKLLAQQNRGFLGRWWGRDR